MITPFTSVLALHVIVAVLGLGSIASIAIVAGAARRTGRVADDVLISLGSLLRVSGVSLGAMLVTGVLLNFAAGNAFSAMWWFRGSALLLIATGVLHALARRTIRTAPAGGDRRSALRRVERIAYAMCALIAVIAVLMEIKPF
jgi:uncharacterized membrane protein